MDSLPNYDTVCKMVGRLFIETQYRLETLAEQVHELTVKVHQLEHLNKQLQAQIKDDSE